jgi:hypothetical protein
MDATEKALDYAATLMVGCFKCPIDNICPFTVTDGPVDNAKCAEAIKEWLIKKANG